MDALGKPLRAIVEMGVTVVRSVTPGSPSLAELLLAMGGPMPEPMISTICKQLLHAAADGTTAPARCDGGIHPGALYLVGSGPLVALELLVGRPATPWHGAPELYAEVPTVAADVAADVWSIGMVAAECALGGGTGSIDKHEVLPGIIERLGQLRGEGEPRLSVQQSVCSTAMLDFLSSTLCMSAAERSSPEALLGYRLVLSHAPAALWLGHAACRQRLQLALSPQTAVACVRYIYHQLSPAGASAESLAPLLTPDTRIVLPTDNQSPDESRGLQACTAALSTLQQQQLRLYADGRGVVIEPAAPLPGGNHMMRQVQRVLARGVARKVRAIAVVGHTERSRLGHMCVVLGLVVVDS